MTKKDIRYIDPNLRLLHNKEAYTLVTVELIHLHYTTCARELNHQFLGIYEKENSWRSSVTVSR